MNIAARSVMLLIIMFLRTAGYPASSGTSSVPVTSEAIALITQISGEVRIKPATADRAEKIDSTTLLYENDEVDVEDGGALLLQVNAIAERLKQNDKRIIKSVSPPPPKRAFTREQMISYKQRYQHSEENKKRRSPRSRRRKHLTTLTLRFGVLLDPLALLAWTPVKDARNYFVRLFDNRGNLIRSTTTSDSQVTFETS